MCKEEKSGELCKVFLGSPGSHMHGTDLSSIGQSLIICLQPNSTWARKCSLSVNAIIELIRSSECVAFCLPKVASHMQHTIFLKPSPFIFSHRWF